jgi:Tol biopolymer transport system component
MQPPSLRILLNRALRRSVALGLLTLTACSGPPLTTDWPGAQALDLPDGIRYARLVAMTPDGSRLALYGEVDLALASGGMYLRDMTTGEWSSVMDEQSVYSTRELAWNADGTGHAFYSEPNVISYDVFTGATEHRLISARRSGTPIWGPSDDQLTVYVTERTGTPPDSDNRVEIWDLVDGTRRRLFDVDPQEFGFSAGIDWSPDGERLLLATGLGSITQIDLFIFEQATGVFTVLNGSEADDVRPSWSRDGRWYAYIEDPVGEVSATLVLAQFSSDCRLRKPANGLLTDVDWYGPNKIAIV